jgi:hypothetical protein
MYTPKTSDILAIPEYRTTNSKHFGAWVESPLEKESKYAAIEELLGQRHLDHAREYLRLAKLRPPDQFASCPNLSIGRPAH